MMIHRQLPGQPPSSAQRRRDEELKGSFSVLSTSSAHSGWAGLERFGAVRYIRESTSETDERLGFSAFGT